MVLKLSNSILSGNFVAKFFMVYDCEKFSSILRSKTSMASLVYLLSETCLERASISWPLPSFSYAKLTRSVIFPRSALKLLMPAAAFFSFFYISVPLPMFS